MKTALSLSPTIDRAAAVREDESFAENPLRNEPLLPDQFGRIARDLRVSLTDRCNLRCTYCMPAEGLDWIPNGQVLSDAEVMRLITIAVRDLGIQQVRFTGGEPLLRKSLEDIIAHTAGLKTTEGERVRTALTTNGLGLDVRSNKLKAAGLDRVNISLDTMDAEHFAKLTRRDRHADVLRGIDAAMEAGLTPLKINSVVMPGVNEKDIIPLAEFCLRKGAQLRFIEQMPLGPREQWTREDLVTAAQILDELRGTFEMTPAQAARGSAPAALWNVHHREHPELKGQIGVIASVTQNFCSACDRTRLTADGAIRNCLFANAETSLRDVMRDGATDTELADVWKRNMWGKLPGHGINDPGFLQPDRLMGAIGG